jgi:cell division protein FtsI/penicillin-binding protein 2
MAERKKNKQAPKRNYFFAFLGFSGRVVGSAIYLAVVAAIAAGALWRIDWLQKQAEARKPDLTKALSETEDAALFRSLLEAKLIVPREDTGLDMVPPDYVLIKKAAGDKGDEEEGVSQAEQEELLKSLYDSPAGIIVRTQVKLWNETRLIAAVRDNRKVSDADANKVLWTAKSESGHPKQVGALVPETFGFVNKDEIPKGMDDWVGVAAPEQKQRIVFATRFTGQSGTISIQVIGNPVRVPPGARIDRREITYSEIKSLWPCKLSSRAALVTLPVRGDTEVEIAVEPSVNCAPRIFGLAISMSGEDLADRPRTRERRKTRKSKTPGKDPGTVTIDTLEWVYNWRPVERPRQGRADNRFVVKTLDGVALTDPNGRGTPTEEAHNLGLLSLIGFGRGDATSITGMLAQTRLAAAGDIVLTIDSRVQKAVQDTVTHYMTKEFDNESRPGRFYNDRRGSVMLIDIDTGAIIGMGSWPLPPFGAKSWDYVSYAISNPNKDPMSIASWELLDIHNTPGSTWKTLLALAAALEASVPGADPRIKRMLMGLDPGEFRAVTGVDAGASTYMIPGSDTRSISNHARGAMAQSGATRDPICIDPNHPDPEYRRPTFEKLGVRLAIKSSYNVYFSRLAVMLEERAVDDWIKRLPQRGGRVTVKADQIPATRFMLRLREFGVDWENPMDLAVNATPDLGLFRMKSTAVFDPLFGRSPLTHITRGEALLPDNAAVWKVAAFHRIGLNGIGQGWSVSTLHVARGAASIASGKAVQPHIIRSWLGKRLPTPPANELKLDPEIIREIRLGMKSVPEAAGSTAVGIFKSGAPRYVLSTPLASAGRGSDLPNRIAALRVATGKGAVKPLWCRMHGKTGTADPAKNAGFNSGWFVGWKEPIGENGRRIAVACMTSHAVGNFRFGGTSCGQIVRDIMFSIELLERPDLSHTPRPGDEPRLERDAEEGTTD